MGICYSEGELAVKLHQTLASCQQSLLHVQVVTSAAPAGSSDEYCLEARQVHMPSNEFHEQEQNQSGELHFAAH